MADKDAFGSYNATVYVPGQAVEAYKEAENWNSFEIRPIGDVNSDEAVNTGDMSAVYGAILGGDPQGFTDLNCDGNINTGDVSALYKALLAGSTDSRYDLNGDGAVNTGDVSALYKLILGS